MVKLSESLIFKSNTSVSTNGRQSMLHALLHALYPVYDLLPLSEQNRTLTGVLEHLAYEIDRNNIYERFKLAHFATKSELQNKLLQYEDMALDKGMQSLFVNYFDVNIIVFSPYTDNLEVIPVSSECSRKGCVVLEKRNNKYTPFQYSDKSVYHHLIKADDFKDVLDAMNLHKKRKRYQIGPYYKYKIDDLIEIAKKFHIKTTKPGRYNQKVKRTKRDLYDELYGIL